MSKSAGIEDTIKAFKKSFGASRPDTTLKVMIILSFFLTGKAIIPFIFSFYFIGRCIFPFG